MLNIHDDAFSAVRRAAGRRNATRIATSFFIHWQNLSTAAHPRRSRSDWL